MPSDAEIEQRFWKELKSTMTMMLGLDGVRDGQVQPMTAQIEGDEGGPLWFFTSKDNSLIAALGQGHRAIATFTSKGHDLFASVSGDLTVTDNRADIERLWNAWVEPWFEGGKDDPKVALLRLDPDSAKIWLNGTGIGAAISRLLGKDPKKDYQDKVAEVSL